MLILGCFTHLIEQQLKTEIEQLKTANNELLAEVKLHKDKLTKANECKNTQVHALHDFVCESLQHHPHSLALLARLVFLCVVASWAGQEVGPDNFYCLLVCETWHMLCKTRLTTSS